MADIYITQDYWKLWRGSPSAYFISISPDSSHRVLYSQDGVSSGGKALKCILRKTHEWEVAACALTLYDIKNQNSNQPFRVENVLAEGKEIVITTHLIWDVNIALPAGFSLSFCAQAPLNEDAGRKHMEMSVDIEDYFCDFNPENGYVIIARYYNGVRTSFLETFLPTFPQGCFRFSVLIPPNSPSFFISAETFSSTNNEYTLPEITWPTQINDNTFRTGQIFIKLYGSTIVGEKKTSWLDFFYIQERS